MRWCAADHDRFPRETASPREPGWANAAKPTRPDTRADTAKLTQRPPSPAQRPPSPTRRPRSRTRRPAARARIQAGAGLAWGWFQLARTQLRPEPHERLADWLAGCVQQLGDLVFAVEDQEAAWHAWDVERRSAGLTRRYRDQRFDALVACPRCHSVSTVADSRVCKQCSATDRLIRV